MLQGIPWGWLRSELQQDAAYRVEVAERLRTGRFPEPPSYHPMIRRFTELVQQFQNQAVTEAMLAAPRTCASCRQPMPCPCCPPFDPDAPRWSVAE